MFHTWMLNYGHIFLTLSQSEKREEIKVGRYRNYRENNAERATGWGGWEKEREKEAAGEEKFSKNEVI